MGYNTFMFMSVSFPPSEGKYLWTSSQSGREGSEQSLLLQSASLNFPVAWKIQAVSDPKYCGFECVRYGVVPKTMALRC